MEDFVSKAIAIVILMLIVRVGMFVFSMIHEYFNPTENDLEKDEKAQK